MASLGSGPNRRSRVMHPLMIAGILLCGLLMVLSWPSVPTAQADGATLRVPADFPTIQSAIDAAQAGDTILVVGLDENGELVTYKERLVITKSLTLIGNVLTGTYELTSTAFVIVDAEEGGRAVTILADPEEVTVKMQGFGLENGRATGLGGAEAIPEGAAELAALALVAQGIPPTIEATAAAAMPDMQTQAGMLRQEMVRLCQQGLAPGGAPACEATLARIDWLTTAALDAQKAAASRPAQTAAPLARMAAAQDVDCGGGLYSRGAAVDLADVAFHHNVASASASGYGGGVCIVQAPPNAVVIHSSEFQENLASTQGVGYGGGLFVQDTTGVTVYGTEFLGNGAAMLDNGYGGGLALDQAPGTHIGGSVKFANNVASVADIGAGGGLLVNRSAGVMVAQVSVFANIAGGGAFGTDGIGGGLAVFESDDFTLTENSDFNANVASLGGTGEGGAVRLYKTTNAQIEASVFQRNTASQGPTGAYGGAIALVETDRTTLDGNHFVGNVSAMFPGVTGNGGALMLFKDTRTHVNNNVFHQNVGAANGSGHGGALMGGFSVDLLISDNQFHNNWAAMLAAQNNAGGGVELGATQRVTVTDNTFSLNIAALYQGGKYDIPFGEGGALAGYSIVDTLIASNTFTGNVAAVLGTGSLGTEGVDGGAVAINRGRDGPSNRARISGNTFINNMALVDGLSESSSLAAGGAVRLTAIDATVAHNLFAANQACGANCGDFGNGGGLIVAHAIAEEYLVSAQVDIDGNTFSDNVAPNGGALLVFGTDGVTVTNNIFTGHRSSRDTVNLSNGILYGNDLPGMVANNTFFANDGSALSIFDWNDTTALIVNNVIVSNSIGVAIRDTTTQVDLRYNLFNDNEEDVSGDVVNTNPITGPVHFLAPELGDFHLMPISAAVNAGDPAGVPPAPAVDIEGAPRPYGPRVDVGAYEWHGQGAFLPVVVKQ